VGRNKKKAGGSSCVPGGGTRHPLERTKDSGSETISVMLFSGIEWTEVWTKRKVAPVGWDSVRGNLMPKCNSSPIRSFSFLTMGQLFLNLGGLKLLFLSPDGLISAFC